MIEDTAPSGAVFASLTPESVLDQAERALGMRCGAVCRPLPSYINRVYEILLSDGDARVVKFYRPGRWSRDALEDELQFLSDLHAAEVPVIPPEPGTGGSILHAADGGGWFAVFPKRGGRALDEPTENEWAQLGRLLARMHAVGTERRPKDRIRLHPGHSSAAHLEDVLRHGGMPAATRRGYERIARATLERVAPLFEDAETGRIHGDCHRMNILQRPGEGFHLIDFDDMAVGPAVQDIWMLLPGRLKDSRHEAERLLDGYETFFAFDWASLSLIEPLRFMRFLHYAAWCARQAADGSIERLAPGWGTPDFWRKETDALAAQAQEIEDALGDA